MYLVENLIRRVTRKIGWEIGSAIENVIWSIGIALFLLCCGMLASGAVAFKIMFPGK